MNQEKICLDATTVYALKNGNTKALTDLFKFYYPQLCLFAARLITNEPAAEEIAEETFMKFWQRRDNFETIQNIKAFLYITTRNSCMDYLRKAVREEHSLKQLTYITREDDDEFMQTSIIHSEVLGEIYREIEQLPPKCKQIFKLSFIEGMKNQEIADHLGLALPTVKNQKTRAVCLLKTVLLKKDVWTMVILLFSLLRLLTMY
ncbi:RNA polymerase sigma-70 factor (ECF subfamily) [Chitinophaga niastensis]|uniref:RNA polymerase sigma-70 factor (ECF subfamily) n=1 Tax=Chitinophaga niastensis TaxID=536980 RepID=A0A2P8HHK9_CHINA|nr:RNA polymerase sigma-70 factor [Chitinophaga niastensis]PSL45681.1 RNA polymerase sigma-70 factor (ECF subfamily) [Chitinophaga niastensis]